MTDNIYPHKVAFTDYVTSFIKKSEAAKLVLKLLDKYGIINLGGKTQSSYDFAKDSNNKIKKKILTKQDIILIGKNTSININKIKNIKF
jgi:dTDP-4-dehydrorhamnose reductase